MGTLKNVKSSLTLILTISFPSLPLFFCFFVWSFFFMKVPGLTPSSSVVLILWWENNLLIVFSGKEDFTKLIFIIFYFIIYLFFWCCSQSVRGWYSICDWHSSLWSWEQWIGCIIYLRNEYKICHSRKKDEKTKQNNNTGSLFNGTPFACCCSLFFFSSLLILN